MDDIDKYGEIKTPEHANDEDARVIVNVNMLYRLYTARRELQRINEEFFKTVPWYNLVSKIKNWNKVRTSKKTLHTHFIQFVWAHDYVMNCVYNK